MRGSHLYLRLRLNLRRRLTKSLIIATVLLVLGMLASLTAPAATAPPSVSVRYAAGSIDRLNVSVSDTGLDGSGPWTDNRCGSCHQIDPLLSHPIDVTPSMPIPSHLPLENGRMTCATCHDNSSAQAHAAARKSHTPLLRGAALQVPAGMGAPAFCIQCHDPGQQTRQAQHGSSLGRAHLAWPARGGPDDKLVAPTADAYRQTYDPQTQLCLSCHDGILSSDIALWGGRREHGELTGEHPIGVSLATAALDMPLRSPAALDPRIRLFDQRVGCTTCHSPFSSEKGLLVMSNHRSRLCLSCHLP
ncbi:cytochrome c3 family protein [Fontivita pretiosa]|uniref:cytochrome c3 family protein n=1 Tax=Fontivita pretiosa TaxID=2989684 RepID=UPI003D185285